MVRQPVQQGSGHLGIAEDGHLFSERQVGGDDQAGLLVQLADQVEQQCAARGRKRQVAQLIQNHGIDQRELFGQIPGFAQLLLFLQQVDQVHGIEEAHPFALMNGRHTQRGGQMRFARSGSTHQNQ